ncbi:MAG TPA: hypothetical protein VGD17_17630 [Chitinophagaceae bacterium]
MKKIHVLLSNVLLVTLLLSSTAYSQNKKYEFSKDRSISQTYNASGSDKLTISNQFGKVVVHTWARNEVKVDVKIEVSSTLKDQADEMFEKIDVSHGKDGNNIYFKTTMDKNKDKNKDKSENKQRGTHSNSINIDYEISMPAGLTLDLDNKFGKTTLPDLQGKVDIEQQFGDLEAGKLSSPGKVIVKFGSATIESVNGGSYDFQFVSNTAVIKNATGDIKVKTQHCKSNGVVIHAANTSSVDVDAQHSDVSVVVPKDMSAQYSVETHFGSFKNSSSFTIKKEGDEDDDKHRGPKFNSSWKGTSGQGKTRIMLDGNFTDFYIGHDAPPAKPKNDKKVRSV